MGKLSRACLQKVRFTCQDDQEAKSKDRQEIGVEELRSYIQMETLGIFNEQVRKAQVCQLRVPKMYSSWTLEMH